MDYILVDKIETHYGETASKSWVRAELNFMPLLQLAELNNSPSVEYFNRGQLSGLVLDDFCNSGNDRIIPIIASPDLVQGAHAAIRNRIDGVLPADLKPDGAARLTVDTVVEDLAGCKDYTGRLFLFKLSKRNHPYVERSVMFMSDPNQPLEMTKEGKLRTYDGKLIPEGALKDIESVGVVPAYNRLINGGGDDGSIFKDLGLVTVHGNNFERDRSTGFLYSKLKLYQGGS